MRQWVSMPNETETDVCQKFMGPQLEICVRPLNATGPMQYDTTMWMPENDEFGHQALRRIFEDTECRILEAAHQHHKIFYPLLEDNSDELTGLSCATNRTLSIIGLDSLIHYQIAEGFGIGILDLPQKTAAVIVDIKVWGVFLF